MMKKTLILMSVMTLIPGLAMAMQTILTPSISVRTEYTDNVDRDSEDPKYDLITSISPSFSLALNGKTSSMSISYSTSKVYYENKPDSDYWRHQFGLNVDSQLTKHLNFSLSGSYLNSEDPADNENPNDVIDPDFTNRRGLNKYQTYVGNADLSYQFGEKDSIDIGFGHGGTINDDPTLEDSNYYRPSLGLTYWFTYQWGIDLSGEYERGEFDAGEEAVPSDDFDRYNGQVRFMHQFNPQLTGNIQYALTRTLYDGEKEDERIHDFSTGFDLQLDQDMSLALQIGYSIIEKSDQDNESEMSGSLDFSKSFQRGSIGINASSGYDYNYFGAENLGLNYYIGGGVTAGYELTRRLSADVYGNYRYSEYRDQIPQRDDHRVIAGCSLSFQLLQWLYANAGYSYSTTNSSEDDNDFTENRVYVSLSATKGFPIWR